VPARRIRTCALKYLSLGSRALGGIGDDLLPLVEYFVSRTVEVAREEVDQRRPEVVCDVPSDEVE